MAQWKVPYASRPTRAALGYRLHHGPGGLLHYSTAPAAAAAVAPDSSRSFCLSSEKVTMQELNGRLASYLQQVQFLEAANQRLEHQIQMELDKKCPRGLRELDGHLRTVSLLQDQISERLSSQAQVKLELLNAELIAFDLNVRCEKECERRGNLEVELKNLKLQEEELQVHRLQLQNQLSDQTRQLMELQMQHQQDMQGLLAQVSGGVTVEMQPNETLDLIQQLDQRRQTDEMLLNKKHDASWFSSQMSMLSSPEVTFDASPGSEVIQAELKELRRTAANLEQELHQLQALNMVLEASGQEQYESVVQQLVVLQQRADDLSTDLESVLQATAQQAEGLQILLDIKSRLEKEILDYRRLLDELIPQGVSSLQSNSTANITSYCITTNPPTFTRNIEVDRTVRVQGGNLRMNDFETVSTGHIRPVKQTPVNSPLSEKVTTAQTVEVHSRTTGSPLTLINASNQAGSFDRSATQRIGERSGRESITIITMINKQSSPLEEKVHAGDYDLKYSIVDTQISQSLDKGAVKAPEAEMNTIQEIPTLLTDLQSVKSSAVEEKTETFTSKKIITESVLQANESGTNIQTEITRTILCAKPDVKQEPHMITTTTTIDPSQQTSGEVNTAQTDCTKSSIQTKHQEMNTEQEIPTLVPDIESARSAAVEEKTEMFTSRQAALQANETGTKIQTEIFKTVYCAEAEVKQEPHLTTTEPSKPTVVEVNKETQTEILAKMNCTESSTEAKHQDPAQEVSLSLETAGFRDVEEAVVTTSVVSGSHILASEEAQSKVSCDLTLMDEKDTVSQEKKGEEEKVEDGPLLVSSLTLSDTSNSEQNKVMEDADTGSGFVEDKVHPEDDDVQNTTTVSTQISPVLDKEVVLEAFEPEMNTEQGVLTLVPDTQSASSVAVEEKTETLTSKQISTDTSFQANETRINIQTEITKTILCPEPDVKQGPHIITTPSTTDPSQQTSVEVKTETETVISAPIDCTEGSTQTNHQDPTQLVSVCLEATPEVVKDVDESVVSVATASSGSPVSNDNLKSEAAGTEILKEVKLEANEVKELSGICSTSEVNVDPDMVSIESQEALLSTTESKTESGVALSSSSNPGMCLSPVDTEINMADQLFCPVDREKHISRNDSEMFLSPHDSDTCLSPVEDNLCLSPNGGEEEEEVSLNLTEANANVRPVEKYVLSTKEDGQALPGENTDKKVRESLYFRSFEPNRESHTLNSTNESKSGSQGIGFKLSSSFGGLDDRSIIANKEKDKQLGIGDLYGKSVIDAKHLREGNKDRAGTADNKDVQNSGIIPGGKDGSHLHKETSSVEVKGQEHNDGQVSNRRSNTEKVFVKSASFGSVPANGGTTSTTAARNSSGALGGNAGAEGRFRHGSGEWIVYGGSLSHTGTSLPSTESKESTSVATAPATSQQETGRFGSRGSGEWIVYGGNLRRKSSLDGGASLPKKGKEEGPSVATNLPTNPPETGRFSFRGSGEWMCYGHKSSMPSAGSEKSQSVASLTETSQPETTFGSRWSGEWRVYGGSTGRMSCPARSDSLPGVESPSVATQLATSPPGTSGFGRFGSEGSGEWRVYGGSTGSLNSTSRTDRVSVSAKAGQVISPPGSQTRVSSAGSGGRLSSGSVVKRSSSLGSGGRLSETSGSHRASSSGRFTSTGSGEWKPVYSSSNARKSSMGSTGRSGGGTTSSQRAPSPGGRMIVNMGSGGWLNSGSTGSGSKLSSSGGSDRISSLTGGRISGSSGLGRTNSSGGRVISSSDHPIRSTGSGAGGSKERISVCKMAALSISAAGRERSQDKQRQAQQQQAAAASPLVQQWLTTGVGITSADVEGLDDIMRL